MDANEREIRKTIRVDSRSFAVESSKSECGLKECVEFELVERERADGGGGGGIASCVERFAAEDLFELRSDPTPRAHILGLFLCPDELRRAVLLRDFGEAFAVEGIELLEADDRRVGDFLFRAIVEQVVI